MTVVRRVFLSLAAASVVHAAPQNPNQKVADKPTPHFGLTLEKVAGEPALKNVVAVSVDADGTIYATETERRKVADLDIRENMFWVEDDLSHTSVAEKQAFFRENVGGANFAEHRSVRDFDGSGTIDWRDLTTHTEKIHRLKDLDGDGLYEDHAVFAEGFNSEVTGIAAGVLAWRGDVFATIAPDVWRLRDVDGDGRADEREAIAHGFGLHINYAGHDMHGLTLGPDGRVYWTIGDKALNVVSEGVRRFYPHQGALLRCWPDGTGFEVYAHGLRNIQEIAFDEFGNLFGVDNDSDNPGEMERLFFIPQGADLGWRVFYQYRGQAYNPWMAERIAFPYEAGRPTHWLPPLRNFHDGPAGFARDPGTALDDRFRGSFFLTQFPGSRINAFELTSKGAGFEMSNDRVVAEGVSFVGCQIGSDGALYAADWGGGYPLNDRGGVWRIDTPDTSAVRREVAEWLKEGPADVATEDLVRRLGHADQRVRTDAHLELAQREAWAELKAAAAADDAEPIVVVHALWGLTRGGHFDAGLFEELAASSSDEVRGQAALWAADCGAGVELAVLLADSSPRTRFLAATAAARMGKASAVKPLLEAAAKNEPFDPYLHHGLVFGLSRSASAGELALHDHPNGLVRRAAIDALLLARDRFFRVRPEGVSSEERLAAAESVAFETALAEFLGDPDPALVTEAAIAIHSDPVAPVALPALAALLEANPAAPEPALRRAMAANRQLGGQEELLRLVRFAAKPEVPEPLRIHALKILLSAASELRVDPVDGRWVGLPAIEIDAATHRDVGAMLQEIQGSPDLNRAAAYAMDAIGEKRSPEELAARARDRQLAPDLRLAALAALRQAAPGEGESTAVELLKDPSPALRLQVAATLVPTRPRDTIFYLQDTAFASEDLAERQNAMTLIGLLSRDGHDAATEILNQMLAKASTGAVEPSLMLELLESAKVADIDTAVLESSLQPAQPHLLHGGDAERGRQIFEADLAANCVACHRIGAEGSQVGPALTESSKLSREYLLESLIDPQAKISEGFPAPSPMPPMGLILKPAQIRDLVEFLATHP